MKQPQKSDFLSSFQGVFIWAIISGIALVAIGAYASQVSGDPGAFAVAVLGCLAVIVVGMIGALLTVTFKPRTNKPVTLNIP